MRRLASAGLLCMLVVVSGLLPWQMTYGSEANRPSPRQNSVAARPATKGNPPMEILAIETKYSPYFEKLICETDILVRLRPLMEKADAMAKRARRACMECCS